MLRVLKFFNNFKCVSGIFQCCVLWCWFLGCAGLINQRSIRHGWAAWGPSGSDFHVYPNPNLKPTVDRDVMVDIVNNLGLRMLAIHNEHNENNIAISPYGALSLLVAIGEGLQGEAVKELQRAIHLPNDISIIRVGLRDIHRHLKSYFIPKEGFLAGLTLNYENVTLRPEYEEILRFYGLDIMSFNSALYPDPPVTDKPGQTSTTEGAGREMTMEMTTRGVSTTTKNFASTTPKQTTTTASTVTKRTSTKPATTTTETTTLMTTIGTTIVPEIGGVTTENKPKVVGINEEIGTTEKNAKREDSTKKINVSITTITTTTVGDDDKNTVGSTTVGKTEGPEFTTQKYSTTLQDEDITETTRGSTMTTTTTEVAKTETEPSSTETITTTKKISTEVPMTTEKLTTEVQTTTKTTTEIQITEQITTEQQTTEKSTIEPKPTETTNTDYQNSEIITTEQLNTEISNTEQSSTEEINTEQDGTETTTLLTYPYPESSPPANTDITTEYIKENEINNNNEAPSITKSKTRFRSKLNSNSFKTKEKRQSRSVVEYVLARYYDDHRNRFYPSHYPDNYYLTPYSPQTHPSFFVQGKYRDFQVNYMKYDTVLPFYYASHLKALALSFPLDSEKYYLLLLLPVEVNGVDKLICDLRLNGSLKHIIEGLNYRHVTAVIPNFLMMGYINLTPTLQQLGIRRVFEPGQADFTPMTEQNEIYITNIEQAITVNVRNYVDPPTLENRRLDRDDPVVEFRVDHPFLYFIMDTELHVALMAGKVVNPLNTRDELRQVVLEWNGHKISKTRNSISPTGRPALLYEIPSIYGAQSYLIPIPAFVIDELDSGFKMYIY